MSIIDEEKRLAEDANQVGGCCSLTFTVICEDEEVLELHDFDDVLFDSVGEKPKVLPGTPGL
jgi:hypothetical protein